MNRHTKILELLAEGKYLDHNKKPRHITTAISNLFLFENDVYKIYRQDADFFNANFYDLSNKAKRYDFTRSDFKWNHNLCSEVYIEVKGLILTDTDNLEFTEPTDDTDELVIVMTTVDMSDGVFHKLMEKTLKVSDCYQIGYQLGDYISNLPKISDNGVNLYDDFTVRQKDIVEWLPIAQEQISKEDADQYCEYLSDFIKQHEAELGTKIDMFGIGLDMHSENALFTPEKKLLTIDTYPPKEDWRRGYKHINIYRIATDIFALFGEDGFREALRGYVEATGEKLETEYENFLVMYSALIMVPYLYMLGEKSEVHKRGAELYHNFLKSYFKRLL